MHIVAHSINSKKLYMSNTIPTNLTVAAQLPNDPKVWALTKTSLTSLGVGNQLAYTYFKGMRVFCATEEEIWEWREVTAPGETGGLVVSNFTYPNGLIVNGVDYSNKEYNFFQVLQASDIVIPDTPVYAIANVGTGAGMYKNTTVVGPSSFTFNFKTLKSSSVGSGIDFIKDILVGTDDITFRFKGAISDTLTITNETNNVRFESMSAEGILQFIVNSDYIGSEELGTSAKPFKNLQNALDFYKGGGTNLAPEKIGFGIIIEKDINVFVGSLAYSGLDILIKKGATLTSNPTYGQYLLDVDNDATLPPGFTVFNNTASLNMSITVEQGAGIILQKQGFKNRGTLLNTLNSIGKQIHLLGKGFIHIANDVSVAAPSTRKIIDINSDNQAGFFNDGNVAHFDVQCVLSTYNTKLYTCGLNGNLYLTDVQFDFGDTIANYNVNTVLFELNGGRVTENNTNTSIISKVGLILNKLYTFSNNSNHLFIKCNVDGNCNYLFSNEDATNTTLLLNNCIFSIVVNTGIILSPSILWTNLRFSNNFFYAGAFNYTQGTLFANNLNFISSNIVETLNTYGSRELAVIAGLFKGCKFINQSIVNSGSFIVGIEYKIETLGSTDFTLIGAVTNTVGVYFTATGVGTGTGTASNSYIDIIV